MSVDIAARTTADSDAMQSPGLLRRLSERPLALVCMAYLLVVIGVAVFAPLVLPSIASEKIGNLLQVRKGPSAQHLLGTDTVGRDVLDRLLVGARITMIGVAELLAVAMLIGVPLGLAAGYLGGMIDRSVSWMTDLTFSIPSLIVILVVFSIFPNSLLAAMVTLGVLSAPGTARVIRAATLPIREELYVAASQVSGLSRRYIITRHILPRISGVVVVQTSLLAAASVTTTAGLAFLGVLGSSTPTWGGMVQDGISVLQLQPWLIWPPGVAIGLTVLALTLLGDSVQDATAEKWSAPVPRRRKQVRRPTTPDLPADDSLVRVEDLVISLPASPKGLTTTRLVDGVSFTIRKGETIGIVGESGCGKTVTALAVLGLLSGGAEIEAGVILFKGRDLTRLAEGDLHRLRGKEIAFISQEPMTSLTPTLRVGHQIQEAVVRHRRLSRSKAREVSMDLLRQVQLPDAEVVWRRYPHELSGGMAQRVAIARALAGEPALLIADEPTTALDVTVQAEILDLLRSLQAAREMAVLLITHDWGVVADMCQRVVVMYAGHVVEEAAAADVYDEPRHPYSQALLSSNIHSQARVRRLPTIPGAVPRPGKWPRGCRFHPRCAYATEACREAPIRLEHLSPDRATRCIHHDQLALVSPS